MVGSVLIFEARNIAEVKKMVEDDIYYTSGVVSQISSGSSSFQPKNVPVGYREGGHPTFSGSHASPLKFMNNRDRWSGMSVVNGIMKAALKSLLE